MDLRNRVFIVNKFDHIITTFSLFLFLPFCVPCRYRFVELYYRRKGRSGCRTQTVVIFLPDIRSCLATRAEWDDLNSKYKRQLDQKLNKTHASDDADCNTTKRTCNDNNAGNNSNNLLSSIELKTNEERTGCGVTKTNLGNETEATSTDSTNKENQTIETDTKKESDKAEHEEKQSTLGDSTAATSTTEASLSTATTSTATTTTTTEKALLTIITNHIKFSYFSHFRSFII